MHTIGNYKVVNNQIMNRMTKATYDPNDLCVIIDGRTKSLLKYGTRGFITRLLPNYAIRSNVPLELLDFSGYTEVNADGVCTIMNYLDRASNSQVDDSVLELPLIELEYHVDELAAYGF